ncbi:M23 family metallopeptidase [Portibacter marinus]|uniref:M23 family metallopeptidase n=1 Tax=Portibacter marinus TaxID=2898660 RepID=UPI001F26647C|nr:M23 family metallopeptidase [Portibacter marinus]
MKLYTMTLFVLLALQLSSAQANLVSVEREYDKAKQEYILYSFNRSHSTQVLTLTFTDANNISCRDGYRGFSKTVARGRQILTKVKARDPGQSFSFGYRYTYIPGNIMRSPQKDFPYIIPLKHGKTTVIKEMTYLNHEYGDEDIPKGWYAIMIRANEADTIFAARRGTVTKVDLISDTSNGNGLLFDRNSDGLTIEHRDGSFADYKIFAEDGIFVKPGDEVLAGEPIGLVGGSNFSFGAHLRFNIRYYKKKQGDQESNYAYIQPYFLTQKGAAFLMPMKDYEVIWTDQVIMMEMNRREKKKYKQK